MSATADKEAALAERARQLELERRAKRQELRAMLRLALAREREWQTRQRKEHRYLLQKALEREKTLKLRRRRLAQ